MTLSVMTLSVKPKTLQARRNGFAGVPEKLQPGRECDRAGLIMEEKCSK